MLITVATATKAKIAFVVLFIITKLKIGEEPPNRHVDVESMALVLGE